MRSSMPIVFILYERLGGGEIETYDLNKHTRTRMASLAYYFPDVDATVPVDDMMYYRDNWHYMYIFQGRT